MPKVSPTERMLMLAIAIFVDVLQLFIGIIPLIGQLINFFLSLAAYIIFGIWLAIDGISALPLKGSKKKIGIIAFGWISDLIPVWKMIYPSFFINIYHLTNEKKIDPSVLK